MLNLTFAGVVAVNRVERLLEPYGLVLKSFNVLAIVVGDPSPLTPTVIGERTLIVKTSITAVLDRLEARGLVRRQPHPGNRRSVLVEATRKGRALCERILRDLHAREKEWLAGMAADDRRRLILLLGQVKGVLSGGSDAEPASDALLG